ncbi:MAG: ATP-binding protein [Verrucomicrobiales bacterium]
MREEGVVLEIEVEDWIPASLLLDAARLRQVVINLVGNAVKFTPAGTVWLRFRGRPPVEGSHKCQLRVEVSDTGVGIPAGRLEHVFDPFVQAKASRDAEMKGTGLGLAIVKRLTSLMGGSLEVRSEEGKGSTFTVVLPDVGISSKLASSVTMGTESAVDFNELRPASLLVVDDNPDNLSVVQGYFDGTHHHVATATNGREALDWLENNPRPDVILMDIRMPVLDGRAALAAMRRNGEYNLLPVIAVTASSLSHEEKALREAFDGYVRKPFTRAQLFSELAQFIPRAPIATPDPAADADGPAPAEWRPLVTRLRALEQTTWPSVRDGMVMSEVIRFGSDLRQLAADTPCPPLEALASRILEAAESFSLESLEKDLNAFPALVSQLDQCLSATPK